MRQFLFKYLLEISFIFPMFLLTLICLGAWYHKNVIDPVDKKMKEQEEQEDANLHFIDELLQQ